MSERFRPTIDDAYIDGMDCAICTAPALRVNHLSEFADFISCDECGSSFVVEQDGDRVLYGKVAEEYTDTEKVVLKNWMSLVVVARLAGSERLRKEIGTPWLPEEEPPEEEPPEEIEPQEHDRPTPAQEAPEVSPPIEPIETDPTELPEEMSPVDIATRLDQSQAPAQEAPQESTPPETTETDLPEIPEEISPVDISTRLDQSQVPAQEAPEESIPPETTETDLPEIPEEISPTEPEFRLEDRLEPVEKTPVEESEKEVDILDALEVPEAVASDRIEAVLGASPESGVEIPIVLPTKEEPVVKAPVEAQREPVPAEKIETEAPADRVEEAPSTPQEKYFRVRLEGESVYFPMKSCLHCMKTPADHKTSVIGSLPTGGTMGRRRRAVFSVPICTECRQKYSAKSEAQKNARLQAHLTALIVGLGLVVAAVGLDVIDMSRNAAVGLLLAGIIAGVGYLLTAGFLLPRTQRIPPLPETHLVQSTLKVRAPDEPAAESYFDFRNKEYAKIFRDANSKAALSDVEEVMVGPRSMY